MQYLPPDRPVYTWLRQGEGIVGWGVAHRITTHDETRFDAADAAWRALVAHAEITDEVNQPGTGLVAFGSFSFSSRSNSSSGLVIPEVIIGRRGDTLWLTTISRASVDTAEEGEWSGIHLPLPRQHHRETPATTRGDGQLSGNQWRHAVGKVVDHIHAGQVDKVVLARDEFISADAPFDIITTASRLAREYASCWTFHVDGLIGATPELLIRRTGGRVSSRVLAGTIKRTGDPDRDAAGATRLSGDAKEQSEHEFAVRSLIESLGPLVRQPPAPPLRFVLELPNVMHLATDVWAELDPAHLQTSSLELAALLHPTAAVCGTPTSQAAQILADHEQIDRGRYAGPVGWLDAAGDGEWGIALRCGELTAPDRIRLFAGCGIMAASDPDTELAETEHKFTPMRQALGVPSSASETAEDPAWTRAP